MKLLLALILCLASLFNGASSYPAAPESAATCAISGLTISDGSESATLPVGIRAAAALGTERTELHLELADDEGNAMPATLQIASDGLRFALAGHDSAYFLSGAKLLELGDINPLDWDADPDTERLQRLGPPLCALLNACLRDSSIAARAAVCAAEALCDGEPSEDDSVRFEGGNMPALRTDVVFDAQSKLKILVALSESDIPELKPLADAALPLFSLANLPALLERDSDENFLPLSIYRHADADFIYTRIESADAEDPFSDRVFSCEIVEYEDLIDLSLSFMDAMYGGEPTEYWLQMTHSADSDRITAGQWSGESGDMNFSLESNLAGNRRTGTCDWSLRLPGNDMEDEDYNPIPNEALRLEYSIPEGEAADFRLELSRFGESICSLAFRALPSRADFHSYVNELREVPISASDFSNEAIESGDSALEADAKAFEQFLGQLRSKEETQAFERAFDSLADALSTVL